MYTYDKKDKTVMVNSSTNISNSKKNADIKLLNMEKTITYDVGDPFPCVRRAQ